MAGETKKQKRRDQLLEVALALFAEKGYHATSISDIIERASVARGTFYNYFDSKRQIFSQLLDRLFDVATESIFSISAADPSQVPGQVYGNIAGVTRSLLENKSMAHVLFEQAVGLDAEANEQLQAFYNRVLARLQRALENGQRLGIVRDGDAAVLATCFLGMIKEPMYQNMLGTKNADTDSIINEIFRIAVEGLLQAPKV